MAPIASGTSINNTHYTYTFLCQRCIASNGTTFALNATVGVMGWALSTQAPASVSDHATGLNRHNTQGNYGLNVAAALAGNSSVRSFRDVYAQHGGAWWRPVGERVSVG
jgi:hypothetical protein